MSNHKKMSFIKSTIRILGYFGLMAAFGDNPDLWIASGILILSELIGIFEELGEK